MPNTTLREALNEFITAFSSPSPTKKPDVAALDNDEVRGFVRSLHLPICLQPYLSLFNLDDLANPRDTLETAKRYSGIATQALHGLAYVLQNKTDKNGKLTVLVPPKEIPICLNALDEKGNLQIIDAATEAYGRQALALFDTLCREEPLKKFLGSTPGFAFKRALNQIKEKTNLLRLRLDFYTFCRDLTTRIETLDALSQTLNKTLTQYQLNLQQIKQRLTDDPSRSSSEQQALQPLDDMEATLRQQQLSLKKELADLLAFTHTHSRSLDEQFKTIPNITYRPVEIMRKLHACIENATFLPNLHQRYDDTTPHLEVALTDIATTRAQLQPSPPSPSLIKTLDETKSPTLNPASELSALKKMLSSLSKLDEEHKDLNNQLKKAQNTLSSARTTYLELEEAHKGIIRTINLNKQTALIKDIPLESYPSVKQSKARLLEQETLINNTTKLIDNISANQAHNREQHTAISEQIVQKLQSATTALQQLAAQLTDQQNKLLSAVESTPATQESRLALAALEQQRKDTRALLHALEHYKSGYHQYYKQAKQLIPSLANHQQPVDTKPLTVKQSQIQLLLIDKVKEVNTDSLQSHSIFAQATPRPTYEALEGFFAENGRFSTYLEQRKKAFALRDAFGRLGACMLACFSYQPEAQKRQDYIQTLKDSYTIFKNHPEHDSSELLENIEKGLKQFKPRRRDRGESLQHLLQEFKAQIPTRNQSPRPNTP